MRAPSPRPVAALAVASLVSAVALAAGLAPSAAMADAAPAKASAKAGTKASAWRTLTPTSCKPLSAEEGKHMPDAWGPYLGAARRCDLTPAGGPAQVSLISVFVEDFYRGKPDNAPWENFPKPMLVDRDFRCLGGLRELYPYDQPRELQLRHGLWKAGVPQEIRVQVSNPAVGGDYALPVLRWDAQQHLYQASGPKTDEDPTCPTP
ncbi:hypothetical protein [Roseateles amylovorans]|uniref:Uncharacterized protein n=1 Tax=Roseateles amylovorans TaxID=2978473 RepID=A0ABY6B702_9BURK|nr:hypothetical protein [Roseateles amylovorans]UXH80612.1 hypothetical protein N4261_12350 [Roseateles amylovorans]